MKIVRMLLVLASVSVICLILFIGCQEKTTNVSQNPEADKETEVKQNQENPVVESNVASKEEPAKAVSENSQASKKNILKVEDIYLKKAELTNKEVTVSGKIVKVSMGIMGSNWLHLQDGSGNPGTNDITITTKATPAIGDKAVITGILATDKDFGAGYKYSVIIENASVEISK